MALSEMLRQKLKPEDWPYRRPNGTPGKTEWHMREVFMDGIKLLAIALIVWGASSITGERSMVLKSIRVMNSNVVALANASNENREAINQLKTATWNHIDPIKKIPCPPDLKPVKIDEQKE